MDSGGTAPPVLKPRGTNVGLLLTVSTAGSQRQDYSTPQEDLPGMRTRSPPGGRTIRCHVWINHNLSSIFVSKGLSRRYSRSILAPLTSLASSSSTDPYQFGQLLSRTVHIVNLFTELVFLNLYRFYTLIFLTCASSNSFVEH